MTYGLQELQSNYFKIRTCNVYNSIVYNVLNNKQY